MTDKIIFDNPWLKVKESPHGYIFSERKGVDSIAILAYTKMGNDIEILTRFQPLPFKNAENKEDTLPLFCCPITGSIDKGDTADDSAIKEMKEEAGYEITKDQLTYLGYYIVGTQTNEAVHMYIIDVTNLEPAETSSDGTYHESVSENFWHKLDFIENNCEYAGLVILINKLKKYLEDNK